MVRQNVDVKRMIDPATSDLEGRYTPGGTVSFLPLLFQTDYRTIDRIENMALLGDDYFYHLHYPIQEVAAAFLKLAVAAYKRVEISEVTAAGDAPRRSGWFQFFPFSSSSRYSYSYS